MADDYYALLGLGPGAADDDVRRAWRRLALDWHPDRAGPGATSTFQKISIAYTVLSDPAARAVYDKRRGIAPPSSRRSEPAPVEPPIRRAPGVMIRRLSGPLNALLARGVAREADDDVIELYLDGTEAAEGGMVTISMRVPVQCPSCGLNALSRCTQCDGSGTIEDLYAAWLAVRPGVTDGTVLTPSARMPGMMRPVTFRVRLGA